MKLIKSLFVIVFFLSANAATAQATAAPQWRELSNLTEVIERIERGNEQSNFEPLKNFAETLHNTAKQLTVKQVPAAYNSKASLAAIKKLQERTATLQASAAAKASVNTLVAQFGEVQEAYRGIAVSVTK